MKYEIDEVVAFKDAADNGGIGMVREVLEDQILNRRKQRELREKLCFLCFLL
jgi:hypothetical protein